MIGPSDGILLSQNKPSFTWTFDDFDNNCEVIDTTTTLAAQDTYVLPVISEDDEVGELGW